MSRRCDAPLSDDQLLDYWTGVVDEAETDRIEVHLFSCAACSARLEAMASLGAGLSAIVRRGRVAGVVSRSLVNRIQRDGVHVRQFTLSPGECVPCAAFPDDELVILSLRANLAGAEVVTLSLLGPDDTIVGQASDIPVGRGEVEVLWAATGDAIRGLPSSRVRVTLRSGAPDGALLGEYALEHTAHPAR